MHLWFLCWQKWCLYTLYLRYPIWWLTCSKHRFYNVSLSQSPDRWKIRNSTQTQDLRIKNNWRLIQFYWWSKTKSVQIGCQPGAFTGLWDQLKHQAYKTLDIFYLVILLLMTNNTLDNTMQNESPNIEQEGIKENGLISPKMPNKWESVAKSRYQIKKPRKSKKK